MSFPCASALLDTLDFLSTPQTAVPPLASGLSQIADLKRRLTMIMQANTPRSLTWPGCLAVVTLGLTVLPMLPSLHGEPPRKEELVRDQIDEAEKALEKAKAALDRQKAELDRKVKELHKAKEFARTELLHGKEERLQVKREAYHIIIAVPRVEDVNPKEIVQEIKKALREKLRDKVVHYHIQIGGIPPIAAEPPPPPPVLQGGRPHVYLDPYVRSQPSSEKRINDLEKKLERVLQELQELRKQMKQPRGGNYFMPSPGTAAPPPPTQQLLYRLLRPAVPHLLLASSWFRTPTNHARPFLDRMLRRRIIPTTLPRCLWCHRLNAGGEMAEPRP
jgi:DNA-binding transcriptional MerR regulator